MIPPAGPGAIRDDRLGGFMGVRIIFILTLASGLWTLWTLGARAATASTRALGQDPATTITASPPLPEARRGQVGRYQWAGTSPPQGSVVKALALAWGTLAPQAGEPHQWLGLHATKANGAQYRVWLLSAGYPPAELELARARTARYVLQEGADAPVEYRDRQTGRALLPSLGGWEHLIPQPLDGIEATGQATALPSRVRYLGHTYQLADVVEDATAAVPPPARVLELRSDFWVGLPSNTRQKDETRRYDDSDYELVRLTRADYLELAAAGFNCLRVDAQQLPWVQDLNVFYWGVGGAEVPYPECLYRSAYLGPTLFLDEPAVVTRDHVIRPRLAQDPAYRRNLTPQVALGAFQEHFRHVLEAGAPTSLLRSLQARSDVDLGLVSFRQANLYSWETMVSTAAYQLSQDPSVPAAMVFEPPGRVGTLRTLPEFNLAYGCQLQIDVPNHFTSVIYGLLRGAARLTDKAWGTSIYGSVDRADASWFLRHAYDLGATHFFFWDNHRLACVPYGECLTLARHLKTHAENQPPRDLARLKRAAEVALLFPPGYNLGHVHLGRGNLWGLGELNLERVNRSGVKHRAIMSNLFVEIERCLRLGVAFDLLWDLPGLQPIGYRELVRIREDGKVEVTEGETRHVLDQPRTPPRPTGAPPSLAVELSAQEGQVPLAVTARARVVETTAPVYYTLGTDRAGVYRNALVAWELYGPNEEDYQFLAPLALQPQVNFRPDGAEVVTTFRLNRPGIYRLRTSTGDRAGRTTVVWTPITARH